MADNIKEVVKLPIEMSCIYEKLLKQLASLCKVQDLESLHDPKDKLQSSLFMKKLDELVYKEEQTYLLYLCSYCK